MDLEASVVSVLPDKVTIRVNEDSLRSWSEIEKLAVGSYLRVSDNDQCAIIAVIDTFNITEIESNGRSYLLDAIPIGFIDADGIFHRGGRQIAIPPTAVAPARRSEIEGIYAQMAANKRFDFASLSQDSAIRVPVDGDRFFNKHIAVVGSTGSGKSHTVARIVQTAICAKSGSFQGLNNSHVIIFDIHSEYKSAFPSANLVDVNSLQLPYWLMNGDELEELLVETGENQAYNQISLLRRIITKNKQLKSGNDGVLFDTPMYFSLSEVINCLVNLSRETRNAKNPDEICIKGNPRTFERDDLKYEYYFETQFDFDETKRESIVKGLYNDGTLEKFISRLSNKVADRRLDFLLGKGVERITFEVVLRRILGYISGQESNVTVVDLSGVPFEVLSITVSLITRLVFDYGYIRKRVLTQTSQQLTPILLVYEEAHKYAPKDTAVKYRASRMSIERVAKEGRKYGVSALIASQRPSEVSDTIFSQCSNFVALRLTNPEDQAYVSRLLPDSLEGMTSALPTLESGEAVLVGDSLVIPSIVKIDRCDPEPSSTDVPFFTEWKEPWFNVAFKELVTKW